MTIAPSRSTPASTYAPTAPLPPAPSTCPYTSPPSAGPVITAVSNAELFHDTARG